MKAHTSTQEQRQVAVSEFEARQGYTVRLCFK